MKKYLPLALLALASCTSLPTGSDAQRVDLVLRNATDHPIELRAAVGIFGRQILLGPGDIWRGWIPTGVGVGEVHVEIAHPGTPVSR